MNTYLEKVTAGKKQLWQAEITESNDGATATATIKWGLMGGKQQTKVRTYDSGCQNRTPVQQAQQEMAQTAKEKQQSKGYVVVGAALPAKVKAKGKGKGKGKDAPLPCTKDQERDASPTRLDQIPLPMLAKEYSDLPDATPIFVQPKLDGLRCMANLKTGETFSRGRKPIECPSVKDQILRLGKLLPDVEWIDGELWARGVNFQAVMKLFRGGQGDGGSYCIYDVILPLGFAERHAMLKQAFAQLGNACAPLELVATVETTAQCVALLHDQFCKQGYEGAMVRLDKVYDQGKRSSSLQKVKAFKQSEYVIVGFEAQKHADKLGAVILELPDGVRFNAQASMTDEQQQELWLERESYIGQMATVKYFEVFDSGIPRFPKFLGSRHAEDM